MSEVDELQQILATPVWVGAENVPFGAMTLAQTRERADELASVTGWGPTARVASVARAWRELSMTMESAGAGSVCELDGVVIRTLAPKLWVLPPGGSLL